jgi:hypothetical protein
LRGPDDIRQRDVGDAPETLIVPFDFDFKPGVAFFAASGFFVSAALTPQTGRESGSPTNL